MLSLLCRAIVLVLLTSSVLLSNTWFVSSDKGNDANGGTSWSDAVAGLNKPNDLAVSAGDTIVYSGYWFFSQWWPSFSGTEGNRIVCIDSFRYTNGVNLTIPDTVWSARINSGGNGFFTLYLCGGDQNGDDDYIDFIGFELWGADDEVVQVGGYDFGPAYSSGHTFLQCKFSGSTYDGEWRFISMGWGDARFVSCLFVGNGDYCKYAAHAYGLDGTWVEYINCTFAGYYNGKGDGTEDYTTFLGGWFQGDPGNHIFKGCKTFKNNIVVNLSADENDFLGNFEVIDTLGNYDYNLYYTPTVTRLFKFNGVYISSYSAYVDSMQYYEPDAEANSVFGENPLFKNTETYYILDDSPAFNVGEDLGYGTSLGYFQPPKFFLYNLIWMEP